jgi:iron-sulfur cluster insertion protein
MSSVQKHSATPITITLSAAIKSWKLIQESGTHLQLRVSILGGGCQGLRYDFSFSDKVEPGDTIITKRFTKKSSPNTIHNVTWVIDSISLTLLRGVEIDYVSDLQGERFVLRHLKVKSTCSCGSSFVPQEALYDNT